MSNTLISPEQETFPNRIRWTRQQCQSLVDTGHLVGRYELIDGEILSKMGQNPPHMLTIILVSQWLNTLFSGGAVRVQGPIRIQGEDGVMNEPEPDIAVTNAPALVYTTRHPAPQDLLLVVEVSDTTRKLDLNAKALLYSRANVREYWVMDIAQRSIHIHRIPTPEGYTQVSIHAVDDTVALAERPEETVRVSALFPPVESTDA